jgi:hypothetical protein
VRLAYYVSLEVAEVRDGDEHSSVDPLGAEEVHLAPRVQVPLHDARRIREHLGLRVLTFANHAYIRWPKRLANVYVNSGL